jgi:AcrR family transcriptional regulator
MQVRGDQESVSPKPARRRVSIGARRNPAAEAAILASARGLLNEKGYAGFSIDEVARRAGAGKPTIYRWWPTKADLFIDVYAAEKSATIPVPDTGDFVEDLTRYTLDLWTFWRDSPSGRTFRALLAEAQASDQALEALRTKFLPQRLQALREIMQRAVARHEIEAADLELLVALYIGFNWFHLLSGDFHPDAKLVRRMARQLAAAPKAVRAKSARAR